MAATTAEPVPLVRVRDLAKWFPIKGGILQRTVATVRAVDGVDLDIARGETLGLVGESGCGKSTLGRLLVRLLEPSAGSVEVDGVDLARASRDELDRLRRDIQMIFQDPFSALDPRAPVEDSIAEGLRIHRIGDGPERRRRVAEMMRLVGLRPEHGRRFPHEFSGGQRQRIGIARALILRPRFVVADEPVSALDVSVQAQVLNLLRELQDELDLTVLFIAHNLAVVEHVSDRVAVMYLGRIVEISDQHDLYRRPTHPYTEALLSAIPIPDPALRRERIVLQGDVPSPVDPPRGCSFHTRCPIADDTVCSERVPLLRPVGSGLGHVAACHLRTGEGDSGP